MTGLFHSLGNSFIFFSNFALSVIVDVHSTGKEWTKFPICRTKKWIFVINLVSGNLTDLSSDSSRIHRVWYVWQPFLLATPLHPKLVYKSSVVCTSFSVSHPIQLISSQFCLLLNQSPFLPTLDTTESTSVGYQRSQLDGIPISVQWRAILDQERTGSLSGLRQNINLLKFIEALTWYLFVNFVCYVGIDC